MAESGSPLGAASDGRGCGLGCLGLVLVAAGFFGGGIIAVFVGKLVGSMRGCRPAEGLPACEWHVYWWIGAAIGALLLPALVWWRLRGRQKKVEHSERG